MAGDKKKRPVCVLQVEAAAAIFSGSICMSGCRRFEDSVSSATRVDFFHA